MFWPICALSSCICGSVAGRGAESVSFDESFGDFSEVGRYVKDVVFTFEATELR